MVIFARQRSKHPKVNYIEKVRKVVIVSQDPPSPMSLQESYTPKLLNINVIRFRTTKAVKETL